MPDPTPNSGSDMEANGSNKSFFAMIPGRCSLKWLPIKGVGLSETPTAPGDQAENNPDTESGGQ